MQCEHCQNWYAAISSCSNRYDSVLIECHVCRFHFGCIGYTTESAAQVEGYSCDLCQGMGAQPTRSKSLTISHPTAHVLLHLVGSGYRIDRCTARLYDQLLERLASVAAATLRVATIWVCKGVRSSCNQVAIRLLHPYVSVGWLVRGNDGELDGPSRRYGLRSGGRPHRRPPSAWCRPGRQIGAELCTSERLNRVPAGPWPVLAVARESETATQAGPRSRSQFKYKLEPACTQFATTRLASRKTD